MDESCKIEGDYHGLSWTTWFLWKEGVKPSDIHRWSSAVCGEEASAHSIVFNWVQRLNSGKETSQAAVHEWYCSTPKEWFCEVIGKLPRRWQ
jgi:hypothetical protein